MMAVEPLSAVDRAWLLMERPTNPMVIVSLIVLGAPLSRSQLRELIASRFLAFERFRCVPLSDSTGSRWVPSPAFDIDDHLAYAALPGARGQRELEALVGELASTPLNPQRPLWTFHLVESYETGSALIVRIHHCYADGMALVRVLLSLTEMAPGGPALVAAPEAAAAQSGGHAPLGIELLARAARESSELLAGAVRESSELLGKGLHYVLHPSEASGLAANALGVATEIARIGTLANDPPTRLKRSLSGTRRVAWGDPLSLEEVRTLAAVLGCTINDVLVSTLAGALGSYLTSQGETVSNLTLHAAVPVNLREQQDTSLGNRFGLVFVELPVGIEHPLERLYAVHGAMKALKSSPQAWLTLGLLWAVGSLPAVLETPAIALFSDKASLVASNLPGPREPLYMAGIPIARVLFWVPQAGSIGTGISMFTYREQVQFGVIADKELIPEPARLIELMSTEFDRLVYLVLLGGVSVVQ